ncbi:hypothetical protein O181_037388 [Austropuccinia psidii MF-1]|uniref:Alpha-1,3-glucosyltransferase n=1 Tax=Austropuccinia psidii MF-1 TaxID=1389203 RepID=A0A9Q3D9A6_9BASI|nr:hypothetical protein [Austropuccinia psidii MF-1]
MFGDLEAQRHWMALTVKVNTLQWYSFDLKYWGLDYPPLTAYHSWIIGHIAKLVNPIFVSLKPPSSDLTGWGEIHQSLKYFLRLTVIFSELLIWIPIVSIYHLITFNSFTPSSKFNHQRQTFRLTNTNWKNAMYSILFILLNPNIILIDNGHFQFNSVMLGLTLASLTCFHTNRDKLGAIFFVCSLAFKQMALYYSPAIFAYLFGKCLYLPYPSGLKMFIKLALASSFTLVAIFSPFIFTSSFPNSLIQAIHRIFPLGRGLFEDKVANFWCAVNVIVKVRQLASVKTLANLSLIATLAAILPGVLIMIWISWKLSCKASQSLLNQSSQPLPSIPTTIELVPFTLFNSSIAFYLFSFQVHEKSILLPILPLLLIISKHQKNRKRDTCTTNFQTDWELCCLFSNVSVFSMWPLLRRDGLSLQYIISIVSYNHLMGYNPLALFRLSQINIKSLLTIFIYLGMVTIHLGEKVVEPPKRFPDLFVVMNLSLSFVVFGASYVWSLVRICEEGWSILGFRLESELGNTGPKQFIPSASQPGSLVISHDSTRQPPKRSSSLQPRRQTSPLYKSEESDTDQKSRSVGSKEFKHGIGKRMLGSFESDGQVRQPAQKPIISSPSGEKLMNRIKNRLQSEGISRTGSSQRLLERQKVELPKTTKSEDNLKNPVQSEEKLNPRGQDQQIEGLLEKIEKKDKKAESDWETALRNSREEAIRKRREELRFRKT